MLAHLGFGTYLFFAAFLAIGGVWVYFYIPESVNSFVLISK